MSQFRPPGRLVQAYLSNKSYVTDKSDVTDKSYVTDRATSGFR